MRGTRTSSTHQTRWGFVLLLAGVCLFSTLAAAHPGSGIVIDRFGQIYFVDMVSGVWKVDTHGALTHLPGPAFHWMALDADNRFGAVRLPSGSGGDVARLRANPVLLLASSFPVVIGRDGILYYPTHGTGVPNPLQMMKLLPSGQTASMASLPSTTVGLPIRDLNGLAAGPEGSVYYTEKDAIRRISRDGHVSIVVENILRVHCASMSTVPVRFMSPRPDVAAFSRSPQPARSPYCSSFLALGRRQGSLCSVRTFTSLNSCIRSPTTAVKCCRASEKSPRMEGQPSSRPSHTISWNRPTGSFQSILFWFSDLPQIG
jgi:hypothetical protein